MNGTAFFPGLPDMLSGMVRGDLDMRRRSLERTRQGCILPTLLLTGGVRAELFYGLEEGRAARLVWLRRRDVKPVLDVRLYLALAPTLAPALPATGAARSRALVPDFLAFPGREEELRVGLMDGGTLTVAFPRPGALRLRGKTLVIAPEAGFAPDYQGDNLTDWPLDALVDCLLTFAHWQDRGMPRMGMVFHPPANGTLGRVMAGILGGYGEVGAALDQATNAQRPRQSLLVEAGLTMPGQLALDRWEVAVRVHQDDQGEVLANAPDLDRQRVDLVARLETPGGDGEPPPLLLEMGLSDVQAGGEKLDLFLAALAEKQAAISLWGGLEIVLPHLPAGFQDLGQDGLARYLTDPGHIRHAVVARMRHDDTDLVLLRGTAFGLGFDLLSQVALQSRSARLRHGLLGVRPAGGEWVAGTRENLAPRYFYRLFRSLHAWQRCLGAASLS